jgi:hypothetical protein
MVWKCFETSTKTGGTIEDDYEKEGMREANDLAERLRNSQTLKKARENKALRPTASATDRKYKNEEWRDTDRA